MDVTCSKSAAAGRQLDVAIALLFNDSDPLAIRTLAAAAHGIFADLSEAREKGSSWRSKVIEDSGMEKKEALRILNRAQNYLKHADKDTNEMLSFEEEENDHLIFLTTIECGGMKCSLSTRMQAFQVWYLAAYPEKIGRDESVVSNAISILPTIKSLCRRDRLAQGKAFMLRCLDEHEPKNQGEQSLRDSQISCSKIPDIC